MTGNESSQLRMREELYKEVTSMPDYPKYYTYVYSPHNFASNLHRINWTPNDIVTQSRWMHGVDLYGFATIHSVVICCISVREIRNALTWSGSCTYLPLRAPPGVHVPQGILYLFTDNHHFYRLRVNANCPMPLLFLEWWTDYLADNSVKHLPDMFRDRFEAWNCI